MKAKKYPGDGDVYPQWVIDAHKGRKAYFEAETMCFDHFGYRNRACDSWHPFQVCITAGGWKAKVLAFIFRIPPCNYTGTDYRCWPKPDLPC